MRSLPGGSALYSGLRGGGTATVRNKPFSLPVFLKQTRDLRSPWTPEVKDQYKSHMKDVPGAELTDLTSSVDRLEVLIRWMDRAV